jgi:hypothetical protein
MLLMIYLSLESFALTNNTRAYSCQEIAINFRKDLP